MRIILLIAVAASFLAGCSGQDPISDEAASKIASFARQP
jgi:PBP1b-binding outer membrane lipoprotein LpoB